MSDRWNMYVSVSFAQLIIKKMIFFVKHFLGVDLNTLHILVVHVYAFSLIFFCFSFFNDASCMYVRIDFAYVVALCVY